MTFSTLSRSSPARGPLPNVTTTPRRNGWFGLVWGALATLEAQVGPALLALAPDGGLMGLEAREAAAVLAGLTSLHTS